MAVALAALPIKLQYQAAEQSAQQDLLEVLLASCRKPALRAPLPGFGRELQPYFGPDETLLSCANGSKNKTVTAAKSKTPNKRTSCSASSVKKHMNTNASANNKLVVNNSNKISETQAVTQAEMTRAAQVATIFKSWAGPGFCNAPTPDKLPKPPLSLLD